MASPEIDFYAILGVEREASADKSSPHTANARCNGIPIAIRTTKPKPKEIFARPPKPIAFSPIRRSARPTIATAQPALIVAASTPVSTPPSSQIFKTSLASFWLSRSRRNLAAAAGVVRGDNVAPICVTTCRSLSKKPRAASPRKFVSRATKPARHVRAPARNPARV